MGYFDDDDSSCGSDTMNDMSCSNISISIMGSRRSGGLGSSSRRGNDGGGSSGKANFKFSWDDSGLSLTKKTTPKAAGPGTAGTGGAGAKGFKFTWDDSGLSSVATEDLEESDSSFMQGSYSRQSRQSLITPLGKALEQVDGVKYKDNKGGGLLGGLYSGFGDDSDDSEEEDDLFLPPKQAAAPAPVPAPAPKPVEPTREITIKFEEPLVTFELHFVQEEDAVLAVWDEDHEAEDHNQIPWDEQDYEELPWHLVPDLDEDDPLTKRVKHIVLGRPEQPEKDQDDESDDEEEEEELEVEEQRHVDRVEALVIHFVLKLKHKRLCRQEGGAIGANSLKGKTLKDIGDDSCTLDTSATTRNSCLSVTSVL